MSTIPIKGHTQDLSLLVLLQELGKTGSSGCLRLKSNEGTGFLYLKAGKLIHAVLGNAQGQEALELLLESNPAPYTYNKDFKSSVETMNGLPNKVQLKAQASASNNVSSVSSATSDTSSIRLTENLVKRWKVILGAELGPFADFEVDDALKNLASVEGGSLDKHQLKELFATLIQSIKADKKQLVLSLLKTSIKN